MNAPNTDPEPPTPKSSKRSGTLGFVASVIAVGGLLVKLITGMLPELEARDAANRARAQAAAATNGTATNGTASRASAAGAPSSSAAAIVATAAPGALAPPAAADRIGVGYRVRGGVFESAISGLQVTPPAGFTVLGREEWISPGLTGPEVIIHNADESLQVYIDNVPAMQPAATLGLLRHIARSGSQLVASTTASQETWSLEVLGEPRTFETIVSPDRVVRDAFFGFEGRAYVVSIQHAPNLQSVKTATAAILSGIHSLPAAARLALRKQLQDSPDAQGLVGAQSSTRGRRFRHFGHGVGWTAPAGLWRLLSDQALQPTGQTTFLGAVDDERGYRLLGGVIPVPNLDPGQVLERLTSEFEAGAGPAAASTTSSGVRYLSRRGTVSRQGVVGPIHVAVLQARDQTFYLRLDGEPDTRDESAKVFEEVVAGFAAKGSAIASEHAAGVYLDHRLGFAFREPPGWKVSASDTDGEGAPGTDVVWTREGTGQVAISAAFHAGSQGYGEGLADVIYAGVREAMQASGAQTLRESKESMAGVPARHLTVTQDNTQVDVYVLARSGVAFLLRSEGISPAPSQLLRDNFELLP